MSGILPRIENKYNIIRNDILQIRDAVVTLINSLYVAKSGDTMTGKLRITAPNNNYPTQKIPSLELLQFSNNLYGWQFIQDDANDGDLYLVRLENSVQTELIRFRRNGSGITIGSVAATSPLQVVGIPAYTNDAAAGTGGLTAGAIYQVTGTGVLQVKQ